MVVEGFAGGSKNQIVQNHHYEHETVVLSDFEIQRIDFEQMDLEADLAVVKHFFKKVNFLLNQGLIVTKIFERP